MGFKLILLRVLFGIVPLFVFTGCGDLEPDMQDTRTVNLNMDFHGKSSSRSSSSISAAELSQYNTHLILALPSWEYLTSTSSYKNFYSSFAQELMNTTDKKVSLEIPLNTQIKIFAFLFKENYSMYELFSGTREVGYYGESQPFSIDEQTNNLSLGISLIQVPVTGTDTGGDTDTGVEDTYDDEVYADPDGEDLDYGGYIDTVTETAAPVISGIISGTFTTSQTFTVSSSIESGAFIEYSLDGGIIWNIYFAAVTLTIDGSYTITARQRNDTGNVSANAMSVTLEIDTTTPTVSSIYPTDNQSNISISDNISVTFSEVMDNTSLTTNTDSTTCSGTFNVSSDNFSSCVQMSSFPTSSNSYKTFTLDPYDNLTVGTTYLTRVTTGVKDDAGNAMISQYATSSGFTTANNLNRAVWSDNFISMSSATNDQKLRYANFWDNISINDGWDNISIGNPNNFVTCSEPNNIISLFKEGNNNAFYVCDGRTWHVGTCSGMSIAVESSSDCSCQSNVWTVRPGTGYNWGGVGNECRAASQTLTVFFEKD